MTQDTRHRMDAGGRKDTWKRLCALCRMPCSLCLVSCALLFATAWPAQADLTPFQRYNPDVDKYSFTKDFIISLSYYDRVARRLAAEESKDFPSQQVPAMQKLIANRTLDNTELRIAKNYLLSFQDSDNALIRKVRAKAVQAYEQLIDLSVREREFWQAFYGFKTTGEPEDFNEEGFPYDQWHLAREKKEVAKGLLEAAVLLKTVLLSAEECLDEHCQDLVLTSEERDKLVGKLDAFARDNMDWGMKPGQSTIEACVAVVREVLEDRIYQSRAAR